MTTSKTHFSLTKTVGILISSVRVIPVRNFIGLIELRVFAHYYDQYEYKKIKIAINNISNKTKSITTVYLLVTSVQVPSIRIIYYFLPRQKTHTSFNDHSYKPQALNGIQSVFPVFKNECIDASGILGQNKYLDWIAVDIFDRCLETIQTRRFLLVLSRQNSGVIWIKEFNSPGALICQFTSFNLALCRSWMLSFVIPPCNKSIVRSAALIPANRFNLWAR